MATPGDILNELRELAPVLLELKQVMRLPDVPAGYFESLPDAVLEQVGEPKLPVGAGLDRNHKPAVPEAYFDALPDQVMQRIRIQEQEIGQGKIKPERTGIHILYFRRLAVAATVLGVIALGFLLFQRQTTTENDCGDGIACLTREEIRQYVQDHADEFEADQIHEAFQPDMDADALNATAAETETDAAPAISEKQIEQYIEENPAMIDFEDTSTDIF